MIIDKSVTLVIPVFNDLSALKRAIPKTKEMIKTLTQDYEIIIAEDGSNDGSAEFAAESALKDPHIRHLHREIRLGRGSALSLAATSAKCDLFCYFDVDLATDLNHLAEILMAVSTSYDIATGSRLLPESNITRSFGREIKSRGYNFLVRLFLKSHISDHQCGFKAFRIEKLRTLIPEIKDTHWFWDTEVLVRAQRKGYSVIEIPVRWLEGSGTTVRSGDIWKMGRAIIRLWWQIHVS